MSDWGDVRRAACTVVCPTSATLQSESCLSSTALSFPVLPSFPAPCLRQVRPWDVNYFRPPSTAATAAAARSGNQPRGQASPPTAPKPSPNTAT
jgi:hypothetical protein